MPFNSLVFVLFFGAVVVVHSLPLPWTIRKFNLLVASYLFYAAWDVSYVLLLLSSTVLNGGAGALMGRYDGRATLRKALLWSAIILSLAMLAAFKYGNELLAVVQTVSERFGMPYSPPKMTILLPVGLSFFTFQAMSYTIDVYRRTIKPATSPLDLALFISFFPVLPAGPIVRAGQFLPQCASPRRATGNEFAWGLCLFTLGLFMKVTLADHVFAPIVAKVYDQPVYPDPLSAWIATSAFASQDYCDFAGYSTCAMGVALCLGFIIPQNFRAPFASIGFRDLWQRWHITFVAWLRDYVFVPLGGASRGTARTVLNVILVFLLVGLWHRATWTMAAFGVIHGFYVSSEIILQRTRLRRLQFWRTAPGILVLWLLTAGLALVAFTFYRCTDFQHAFRVICAMANRGPAMGRYRLSNLEILVGLFTVQIIVALHWLVRDKQLSQVVDCVPWWVTSAALAAMILAITLSASRSDAFLYFQF